MKQRIVQQCIIFDLVIANNYRQLWIIKIKNYCPNSILTFSRLNNNENEKH